jgi:hypothetical protein
MPRRASNKPEDANQAAFRVVRELTAQTDPAPITKPKPKRKNPAAVALGKLGASKGGKARAAKLTAEHRRRIARQAAKARWGTEQDPK